MNSNYFSQLVEDHKNNTGATYQVYSVTSGHILKETKDIAMAELTKQNYISIGWNVDVRIKKD